MEEVNLDISILRPMKPEGMALLNKVGKEFSISAGPTGSCKAYLWDCVFLMINNDQRYIYGYIKEKLQIEGGTLVAIFNKFIEVDKVLERLSFFEKKLRLRKTKVYKFEFGYIFDGSVRWLAHVNMFSLFLSCIRYSNLADKESVNISTQRIDDLIEWYSKNCKGRGVADGWPKEQIKESHCLGIKSWFNNHFKE